ncbi:MAG TPA: hypothetical protein VKB79_13580 [Bryobacteraceae bacterium]|nr:hypothetical protein [Bryobacteraceae bacterium]
MIHPAFSRPLSLFLALVIASPYLAAQNPPAPAPASQANAAQAATPPSNQAPVNQVPVPGAVPFSQPHLNIVILEGDKAVNSIPTLQSTAVIVEVRDENEFPVEGAEVVFTLPGNGNAGTFARNGLTYTTRTDASGQAAAPALVPKSAEKFEITVTATLGARKGEAKVTQTNSARTRVAEAQPNIANPGKPFYKKKLFWIITGAAVTGIVLAVVLTSSSETVTVTPGTPVFH